MLRLVLHDREHQVGPRRLAEMFELRHRVFRERLKWDVRSRSGLERDCYDDLDATYGLCLSDSGCVVGCWRLLPTLGPYLLRDVFPQLLGDHRAPAAPTVWEASRFACAPPPDGSFSVGRIPEATTHLIGALLEVGLHHGLGRIVAVSDIRFERMLRRCGLRTHRFSLPVRIGNTMAVAGWFDVTEENLNRVRAIGGLIGDVLPLRIRERAA